MPKKTSAESAQLSSDKKLGRDLLVVCSVITLVFTPSLTIDAFNPSKFFVMCLGVSYLLLRYKSFVLDSFTSSRFGVFFAIGVIISSIALFANQYSFSERLFGIEGRNFGFVTVVCFFALGFIASIARRSGYINSKSVFSALMISNLFVSMIFLLQLSGWAFTEFENDFGVLPSTLGNPNFLSSFLAISIVGILSWFFHPQTLTTWKPLAIFQVIVSLWIIGKTQSIQGFVALALGVAVLILFSVKKFFPKSIFLLVSVFVMVGTIMFFAVLFGFFWDLNDKLPQTLRFRIIYWKIAIQMVQESPFLGSGFDSYLDNFRSHLKLEYVATLGDSVISDSPHNLYLDFFVSGGTLLGLYVLACLVLLLSRGLKELSNRKEIHMLINPDENLFAILIMFLAVAFISPFQLSLFIWLPIILGVATSYERQDSASSLNQDLSTSKKSVSRLSSISLWMTVLVICNPVIASLPIVTEVRYRSAVLSGNFYDLKAVALAWPYSGGRATAIASGMLNSSFAQRESPDQMTQQQLIFIRSSAIDIVESSVIANSKNYESWLFLFQNAPDSTVKSRALQSLRIIDPFNRKWLSN